MPLENNLKRKTRFFQKPWFMWLWLIILPPLGILLLWRQGRFTKFKGIIITLVFTLYFIFPIVAVMATTVPLFQNQKEFLSAFNNEVKVLDLAYSLENTKKEKESITSKLGEDITLVENIDDKGAVQELIMVGQGEGKDILLTMGLLIGTTNTNLSQEEIGQVLKDLRLFDKNYKFQMNETTTEKNNIRYNLKYDQSKGLIFSVSHVN